MRERFAKVSAFIPNAVLDAYLHGAIFFPDSIATTALWLAAKEKHSPNWKQEVTREEAALRQEVRAVLIDARKDGITIFDQSKHTSSNSVAFIR